MAAKREPIQRTMYCTQCPASVTTGLKTWPEGWHEAGWRRLCPECTALLMRGGRVVNSANKNNAVELLKLREKESDSD